MDTVSHNSSHDFYLSMIPKSTRSETHQTCRKCGETKPLLLSEWAFYQVTGYPRRAQKVCRSCKERQERSRFKQNGELKARHRTRHPEKTKAYTRDKKCIYPSCRVESFYDLDFDHAFSSPLEKLPRDVDWNLACYGTMKCRKHHMQVKEDKQLYRYSQLYLRNIYQSEALYLPPLNPEEMQFLQDYYRAHA